MCYTWQHPSEKDKEITAKDLASLPRMVRLNVTGGEPFIKEDLGEILDVVKKKARRVVISTNGFLTKKTIDVMQYHRDVGVRVSFDGVEETHDRIRGQKNAHRRAMDTLKELLELGIKDLGIAVTISDQNASDLVPLFKLAEQNRIELATAILHNAYYFHKEDNEIRDKRKVETETRNLLKAFLDSPRPKNWFRAYFTQGIIDHMYGKQRAMKCTMGTDSFYIDPFGYVRPCNVMDLPFGNLRNNTFQEIWTGPEAADARKKVNECSLNCWMIGSVGHLIRKNPLKPFVWIARNKWGNGVQCNR
jgi:MoaA/NifB/PqqE/SkfB family radical SAM enzyme